MIEIMQMTECVIDQGYNNFVINQGPQDKRREN